MSDVVARRVREVRRRRGWTMAQLAERCAAAGASEITENALENLESGRRSKDGQRRRAVTVDELLALAVTLDVAPVHLLVPPVDDDEPYLIVGQPVRRARVRAWIRGVQPIRRDSDPRLYFSEVPQREFYSPATETQGPVQGAAVKGYRDAE